MGDEELYEPFIPAAEGRALSSPVESKNGRRRRSGVLVEDESCTGVDYPVRTPEIVVELAALEETLSMIAPSARARPATKSDFFAGVCTSTSHEW